MEKKIIIAPVGEDLDSLFVGIKNFPTEKIILIADSNYKNLALEVKRDLEKFKIQIDIKEIKSMNIEEIFEIIARIKQFEDDRKLIINASAGDKFCGCAVTCAGYVNGIRSFFIINDEVIVLPIMRFSYYKFISEKKMELLKLLYKDKDCCDSLEELSRKTKMSLPLLSYYVNGSLKIEGLKSMGLIDVKEAKGKVSIKLSMLGRMLIKGYIPSSEEEKNKKRCKRSHKQQYSPY